MVLFARLVRVLGIGVSPRQLRDWFHATDLIDLGRRSDFQEAAEAVLVSGHEDLDAFRRAFDLFWQARDPRQLAELDLGLTVQRNTRRTRRQHREAILGSEEGEEQQESESESQSIRTYSDSETLHHKDFAELQGSEIEEVRSLMSKMKWRLDERRTRRRVHSPRGRYVDPRRSMRRSLAKGGELLEWSLRDRKQKRRPLVVLCDISGSMEPYSRILLQFLYAITNGMKKVEAFVFGTRLTRITQHLRQRDVDLALRSVHVTIQTESSGRAALMPVANPGARPWIVWNPNVSM